MPKYYRFRATTPTRKPKRKEKERDREIERNRNEVDSSWLDLTFACTPAPSWYLRRIAWRESPHMMGLPRQLATGLQASLQNSNRPIYVFKFLQRFAPKI
ncbi:unnamed protein product [Colias eurytheme]|nr:unnamed protein product [Colias eurytheme]